MRYKAGDTVWYRGQFADIEYEGVVRGPADHQPDASEPTYVLTLLSGPYEGHTSTVYERELRPHVRHSTHHHGDLVERDASSTQHAAMVS